MRSAVIVLAFTALVVSGASSCWIDTRTGELRCSRDADCAGFADPARSCDEDLGYCVEADCPGECDTCVVADRTCTITCTSSDSCGIVDCPNGYHCTITCSGMDACNTVDCRDAASCKVTCSGGNNVNKRPCDDVECGDGPCDVTCSGYGCGEVDCNDSCDCPVICAGEDSCGTPSTCGLGCGTGPNGGCAPCETC